MNGESKNFALAFAGFTVGAAVAALLSNAKTREKITEQGKKLLNRGEA